MIRTYRPSVDDSVPETDERLARCLLAAIPDHFEAVTVAVAYCPHGHLGLALTFAAEGASVTVTMQTCSLPSVDPAAMREVAPQIAVAGRAMLAFKRAFGG